MYQNKILSLQPKRRDNQQPKKHRKTQNLHPIVRKRRLLYLCWMVLFLFWFVIELFIQQGRIWDHEKKLAQKQHELVVAQNETKKLQKEIQLLKSPHYLIELAHKLGYSKPEEENYRLWNKDQN